MEITKNELQGRLTRDIQKFKKCLLSNLLYINGIKTKCILFKYKNKPDISFNILVKNTEIDQVDHVKYLGFTIDEKLALTTHLTHVINQISQLFSS